jgi:hypothetical protein
MDSSEKPGLSESAPVPSCSRLISTYRVLRDALWYGNDNDRIQERLRRKAQQDLIIFFQDYYESGQVRWNGRERKQDYSRIERNDHYERLLDHSHSRQ